jgi:hypothetical protein
MVFKGDAAKTWAPADAPQLGQKFDPAGKDFPH